MRRLASNLALAALSLLFVLGALEVALRVAPRQLTPMGSYGSSRFELSVGLGVHGSTAIYNGVRFVEKQPNSRGWLDVEHAREKPPGTLRIGFFGDSYVEALQVPTETTFFRRLPDHIAGVPVEILGFGMSGWGTLHALRAARSEGERFDVDIQVYVFVENDPGDNLWSISGGPRPMPTPYAELRDAPPGYALRWTHSPDDLPFWYAPGKALQSRLRTVQVLWARLSLLRHLAWRERFVNQTPESPRIDRPAAPPLPMAVVSSWPEPYQREAKELGRRILTEWRRHALEYGRELVVLYVPRNEAYLRGEVPATDSWNGWLLATSAELGIDVIDPTRDLLAASKSAGPMFDDHFSPVGHRVVAEILGRALEAPVTRLASD